MNKKINKIAGTGILIALLLVFQLIANYITIGQVSINLSLIPIVLGAIIYGPSIGFLLGLICGILVIISPSTLALFMPDFPIQTIIICLLKTSVAGAVAGFVFKLLKEKNFTLGIILSSIIVPLINTGIFALAMMTLFQPLLEKLADAQDSIEYLFLTFIGINFVVEFILNCVLTPTIISLARLRLNKKN